MRIPRLWRRKRRPDVVLIVMRLVDMHRVHPDMVAGICSRCTETCGIYPSGQRVLAETPDVKIVCTRCHPDPLRAGLAPGALEEPLQSIPNPRWHK
jgi:hypothetical protein